ncbi:uncharacterized protein LOC132454206 [Gadus macrocephalus]|uniref:uncharacterized protein LOC132454206 n=1 Tax=Gadus macrocephalus TaxID=80720 RepID=UPI0028CB17D3|nr:uncharacterized protein LOC132454206 [Gadus macrocephalus]
MWASHLKCPADGGKLMGAGLYEIVRRVSDRSGWYYMATEGLQCPSSGKKVAGWSQEILEQLDVAHRNQFVHAADHSQAVKLVNVRKGITFISSHFVFTGYSNPGGFDVLVSSRSRLDVSGDLAFPRRVPRNTDKLTIAQVLNLGPRQRVGVIEVRVVQIQGAPVELKCFEVCDGTGQTASTVWDRLILSVQVGKCYSFQALSTRKDANRTVLTTTPSSVVTLIAGIGQPSSLLLMAVKAKETLRGLVSAVNTIAKPRCPRCHTGQDNLGVKLSTHRCERCSMHQHTASYLVTYSGKLIVVARDGEECSMVLTNSAVSEFVRAQVLLTSAHDAQALEEIIIAMPELEVTFSSEGLVERLAPPAVAEATVHSGQGNVPDAEEASTSYVRDSEAVPHVDDEGLAELFDKHRH